MCYLDFSFVLDLFFQVIIKKFLLKTNRKQRENTNTLDWPESRHGRKENAVSVSPTPIAALGQIDTGGAAPV